MMLILLRLFILIPVIGVLGPVTAGRAQSQMPDQGAAMRVVAGAGLSQKGRTLSLSVPVSATNGGAGKISGVLKGNGSGTVTSAVPGTDYAPATSGTTLLKGNGAGGFTSAVSGTDYAPATSGSSIMKGNGGGAFANAVSGVDYAPPTNGNAVLKGNGSGGFASATSGSDYAPPTSGSSVLKANGSGGFSNAVSGTDYQAPISGNSLTAHNFANSISSAGAISGVQPSFGDLSGSLTSSQMPSLTGDTTSTAGSTVTTTLKLNGVSYAASPSLDTVPVITGVNLATYTPLPNCPDVTGSHLNYSTVTHTFSCGNTSSAGSSAFPTAMTSSVALSNYGGL